MCRFGCPHILITDQVREFINRLSSELYSITKTHHQITSAYHPQVNLNAVSCNLTAAFVIINTDFKIICIIGLQNITKPKN